MAFLFGCHKLKLLVVVCQLDDPIGISILIRGLEWVLIRTTYESFVISWENLFKVVTMQGEISC